MRAMEHVEEGDAPAKRQGKPKTRRRMTEASARNQALAYLARYAASRHRVERFLLRRLRRAEEEGRAAIGPEQIQSLLDDLSRLGLIDDEAFALTKARSLARRGLSERGIRARLADFGISADDAQAAIAALDLEVASEEARAWHYCKRRRIGPYRSHDTRADNRQRDLAALGRRGFSYDTAKAVVDAAHDPGALTHEIAPNDDREKD